MAISEALQEFIFALIEQAAIAGDRCPQNDELVIAVQRVGMQMGNGVTPAKVIKELARAGRVRGGVYGKNWRRLWIARGPHAGKSTKACAGATRPHMIYDRFGVSRASDRRPRTSTGA